MRWALNGAGVFMRWEGREGFGSCADKRCLVQDAVILAQGWMSVAGILESVCACTLMYLLVTTCTLP